MKNNMILLPIVQRQLEEDSVQALQNKEYEVALEKLNELISFGVMNYQTNINKLNCLIHLSKYEELIEFSEKLLELADDNYFDYYYYYLMALYEKNEYHEVVSEIDVIMETKSLPIELTEKFSMMAKLAAQMNQESIKLMRNKFDRALMNQEIGLQWLYLQQLKRISLEVPEGMMKLLNENSLNPVIKTFIFIWCQETKVNQEVTVEKFTQVKTIIPSLYPRWNYHPLYIEVKQAIADVEQNNPTLHEIMLTLLESFFYANYPIVDNFNRDHLIEPLIYLAEKSLGIEKDTCNNERLTPMIDIIEVSHELYENIVLD